jgi:hypothetical protein
MSKNEVSILHESNRVNIILERTDSHIPSAWEISNFVENFSSNYLKIGIINQISNLLNQGVNPRNIFILDQSFNLHQKYKKLDGLKLFHKIMHLYPVGVPYGLYPSIETFALRAIFIHFRKCNETLYKHRVERLKRKDIDHYSRLFYKKNLNLEEIVSIITTDATDNVRKSKTIRKTDLDKFLKVYENILKETIAEIRTFESDEIVFNDLEEILSLKKVKVSKFTDLQKKMFEKYYSRFYYYLSKVSRPVVCYYDLASGSIEILGVGNVNISKRDNSFIDVKSISHNSPVIKDFILGMAGGLATVYETVKDEQRKDELHQKQMEKENRQIELLEIEKDISMEELAQAKLKTTTEMLKFIEDNLDSELEDVDNKFLKSSLEEVSYECQKRTKNLMYNNKLGVKNISVAESKIDYKI